MAITEEMTMGLNWWHGEVAEDHLHGEQRAGQRGVEGGGDPGRRTAADVGLHPAGRDPQELPHHRADGRADLDDGPFTAGRPAGADGDRRADELGHHHPGAHHPALAGHRLHHLGHAVALGLAGEEVDQRADDQAARRRDEDQDVPGDGADRVQVEGPRAVGDPLDQADEMAEPERREASAQTDEGPDEDHEDVVRGLDLQKVDS